MDFWITKIELPVAEENNVYLLFWGLSLFKMPVVSIVRQSITEFGMVYMISYLNTITSTSTRLHELITRSAPAHLHLQEEASRARQARRVTKLESRLAHGAIVLCRRKH